MDRVPGPDLGQNLPELPETLRVLRTLEPSLRARSVRELYLFGSVARGDANRDSDVDLALAFDAEAEPSLFDIVHLKALLEHTLGRPVDLGELETMKPRVAAAAAGEMIRVF
jgi:predicted nucleotidyltransferase